jgi:hypothetical protein
MALVQLSLAMAGTLTPWKGGGFGMFASLDSPQNRFVVVQVTDAAGDSRVVRIPFGRFTQTTALSTGAIARVIAFPTAQRLKELAIAVDNAELEPAADVGSLPVRLQRSRRYGPALAGASRVDTLSLELVSPRRNRAASVPPRSVTVTVYRLFFSRSAGHSRIGRVAKVTIAGASGERVTSRERQ